MSKKKKKESEMGDMQRKRVLHTLPLHVSSLTMPLVLPILPSMAAGK